MCKEWVGGRKDISGEGKSSFKGPELAMIDSRRQPVLGVNKTGDEV